MKPSEIAYILSQSVFCEDSSGWASAVEDYSTSTSSQLRTQS